MKISPLPKNERERLLAMKSYLILDTEEEKDFDDITELAAQICDKPIAIITLIDEKRQWFKAKRGWSFKETHRNLSFCAHTIHMDDIMMIPDTLKDERFFDNPLVTEEPAIRFYAGMPLITGDGYKLGSLAVIDKKPGMLSEDQLSALRKLARQVVNLLSLRLSLMQLDNRVKEKTAEIKEVFERVSDAFVALDKNWQYTYVNERAEQIFNQPPGYLLGKNIWAEFPGGIDHPFYQACHRAMKEQQEIQIEEYYQPYDKWFENHIYPSPDGLSIFFRDITEKKKAEEKLRMADQRLAYHLYNSPLGVIEWDKDFIIRSWSAQAENIFGWSEAEVINKHFNDISLVVEADAPEVAIIANELMTGAVNSNKILNRNRTRSGNIIYCQWFNSVLKDEKEGTQSILSLIQDVTVQKKGEEEIKKTHERFEMIADTTYDAIWEWNLTTGELWANELHQQLYGLTKADPVPTEEDWKKRIHPEDRNKTVSAKDVALTSAQDYWESEYRFQKPDGSYIVLFDRSYIIRDPEGKAIRLTGSMFDITERKKAEETVKHSEEKRRLIMNAALDAIICIDTKGIITFWNPQAEQIFGWKVEEVIGRILSELIIPQQYRIMHDKGIERYVKTGYGPRLNELLELSAIDRSGREFPIELTVLPIKQVDEEFFCAFIRDITSRKNAEDSIKQTSEQLRQLARHLQIIREEERKRIAREIHDELGQQLTAIKMDVAWVNKKMPEEKIDEKGKLKNVIDLLDGSNQSIRRILSELRPAILDDHGLLDALEWLGIQFTAHTDIPVKFTTTETELKLPEPIATCIFRVYQEALTNITRYAQASKVFTSLSITDDTITVSIQDDGKGFDTAVQNRKSFGILGMKERLLSLNGNFELISAPGKGTEIIISIPYQADQRFDTIS